LIFLSNFSFLTGALEHQLTRPNNKYYFHHSQTNIFRYAFMIMTIINSFESNRWCWLGSWSMFFLKVSGSIFPGVNLGGLI